MGGLYPLVAVNVRAPSVDKRMGSELVMKKYSRLRSTAIFSHGVLVPAGRDSRIAGKTAQMTIEGLEELMEEFPVALDVVKPLCRKIRSILFYLDQDGRLTFGTPSGDPDLLYGHILAAFKALGFNEAISTLWILLMLCR
ncbi:hypothetical protein E4U30_007004 [Claviceps sp. LM220 group G6]|nr:hypothetical protein E4U30_007004 [Claviceps sp. LM220 group G6]KAG6100963.1 hypothetical protein E4U14_006954 [Claviceps sp. LM454 group G7]